MWQRVLHLKTKKMIGEIEEIPEMDTEEFQRWLSVESSLGLKKALEAEKDHWQTVAEELKHELIRVQKSLSDMMTKVYDLELKKATEHIKP